MTENHETARDRTSSAPLLKDNQTSTEERHINGTHPPSTGPSIGIVVVAYNAESTLEAVLDRIPSEFVSRITEVLVCDDHSQDSTHAVAMAYQRRATDLVVSVYRHPHNLGYGGNQKAAYAIAKEHGLDIVVLLHGDGQYAPELLPEMVAPLERGDCDAVMGSRMLVRHAARAGGMPLYKYVGNRILTRFENRMLGVSLSEFHSGYRSYRVAALDELPLARNDDGFAFDTQIIIQLHNAHKKIMEIPIPTYYGDEICHVNGMRYAREISTEALRYRLWSSGFGSGPRCLDLAQQEPAPYTLKPDVHSSHGRILSWLTEIPSGRILDLGCSSGLLSEEIRALGHHVVGVDVEHHDGVENRLDQFVEGDLESGIPSLAGEDFDVVVAADVLEHVRSPSRILEEIVPRLSETGVVIACVPNFGHWYPRLRTLLGRFDYDRRGILDSGHVRFFTKRSFERLVTATGWSIRRFEVTGLPLDVLSRSQGGKLMRLARWLDNVSARVRPQFFGYQFIYEIVPSPKR